MGKLLVAASQSDQVTPCVSAQCLLLVAESKKDMPTGPQAHQAAPGGFLARKIKPEPQRRIWGDRWALGGQTRTKKQGDGRSYAKGPQCPTPLRPPEQETWERASHPTE